MKHLSWRMNVLSLMGSFLYYSRLKLSRDHNSACKNLSLSACRCWDNGVCLRKMERKFKFGGTNNYGNCLVLGNYILSLQGIWSTFNTKLRRWSSAVIFWWKPWLLIQDWTGTKSMFDTSRDCTSRLSFCKTLLMFLFPSSQIVKQYVLHCTRLRAIKFKRC